MLDAGCWIFREYPLFIQDRASSIEYLLIQPRGYPFHFRSIRCGLLRDNDVTTVWQHSAKTLQHSVCTADDLAIECRIDLVEPAGQPDSARHGINFRNDVTLFGQNKIGANHPWQIVSNFFAPRKLNQLFGFTGVEIARYSRRLLVLNAQLIELITGALKNE